MEGLGRVYGGSREGLGGRGSRGGLEGVYLEVGLGDGGGEDAEGHHGENPTGVGHLLRHEEGEVAGAEGQADDHRRVVVHRPDPQHRADARR
eukprot:4427-Pyramimonas_sp.AAC.1